VVRTNRTPGLHDVTVWVDDVRRRRAAEHDVELREAEDEAVAAIDQYDLQLVTQCIGEPGGQLQPTEPHPT